MIGSGSGAGGGAGVEAAGRGRWIWTGAALVLVGDEVVEGHVQRVRRHLLGVAAAAAAAEGGVAFSSLFGLGADRGRRHDMGWAGLGSSSFLFWALFCSSFLLLVLSSSSGVYTSIHRIVQSKAKPARKQPANPSYREIRIKEEDERDSFELEIEMKPKPFKEEFTLG